MSALSTKPPPQIPYVYILKKPGTKMPEIKGQEYLY